jgi:hypothetical protein
MERGKDKQLAALAQVVQEVNPDVLLLTKVDFDAGLQTSEALRAFLEYPHMLAHAPNSIQPVALDLDGDGRKPDRQVWARYAGEGAMLLLSRYPMSLSFHLNDLLWKDVPDAQMPEYEDKRPFPSKGARDAQKLVGQGFWVVQVDVGDDPPLAMALFQNQAPVFDGPEDMNGLRSRAQLGLLSAVMDGEHGPFPKERFVLLGNTNLDPERGDGDRGAMARMLSDPRIKDPESRTEAGETATAYWENPGPMRVSYVLPSRDWDILDAGVFWPNQGPLREVAEQASRHRLVWVDIRQ